MNSVSGLKGATPKRYSSPVRRSTTDKCGELRGEAMDQLVDELERLVRVYPDLFRGAVLVIDGPVGPQIDAIAGRSAR